MIPFNMGAGRTHLERLIKGVFVFRVQPCDHCSQRSAIDLPGSSFAQPHGHILTGVCHVHHLHNGTRWTRSQTFWSSCHNLVAAEVTASDRLSLICLYSTRARSAEARDCYVSQVWLCKHKCRHTKGVLPPSLQSVMQCCCALSQDMNIAIDCWIHSLATSCWRQSSGGGRVKDEAQIQEWAYVARSDVAFAGVCLHRRHEMGRMAVHPPSVP